MMVLFAVKLIIYGEFTSVTNSSNPQQPAQMDFTIETTVHCVLRNDDNVDVSSSIVIKDHENPCHEHLANICTAVQVVCLSIYLSSILIVSIGQNDYFKFWLKCITMCTIDCMHFHWLILFNMVHGTLLNVICCFTNIAVNFHMIYLKKYFFLTI